MSQNKKYDCTSYVRLRKAMSKDISFHFSNFCQKGRGKKKKEKGVFPLKCHSFS